MSNCTTEHNRVRHSQSATDTCSWALQSVEAACKNHKSNHVAGNHLRCFLRCDVVSSLSEGMQPNPFRSGPQSDHAANVRCPETGHATVLLRSHHTPQHMPHASQPHSTTLGHTARIQPTKQPPTCTSPAVHTQHVQHNLRTQGSKSPLRQSLPCARQSVAEKQAPGSCPGAHRKRKPVVQPGAAALIL